MLGLSTSVAGMIISPATRAAIRPNLARGLYTATTATLCPQRDDGQLCETNSGWRSLRSSHLSLVPSASVLLRAPPARAPIARARVRHRHGSGKEGTVAAGRLRPGRAGFFPAVAASGQFQISLPYSLVSMGRLGAVTRTTLTGCQARSPRAHHALPWRPSRPS